MTFIRKSGGRAVGDIFMHSGTTPPRRALACDAGRYYVTDYPRLFAVIQHRYAAPGDDTGDGLFRVPGSETVQPFFRQAEKISVPGLDFTPTPSYAHYTNMTGTEGVNYGYDAYEISEGPEEWDVFRATRNGSSSGAWSRYRWVDATQGWGAYIGTKFFMPVIWQGKFNSNCNTYHHFGLINGTDPAGTALSYGIRIQAQQSGGTRLLSNVSALTPGGGVTNITGTVFPSGTPTFAGDTLELSMCLWFDLDGLEWGVQVGQISVSMGAMSAIPPAGLCPSYMINWTGPGDAEGSINMLHNSVLDCAFFGGLSPSAWDVAPINPPSGYANLFDWPDVVTYETGATGGAVEHQHGGYALTGADLPALDVTTQGYEGSSAPAVDSVAYSATPGTEHTHPAASSLPPYVDVLYCIQAK